MDLFVLSSNITERSALVLYWESIS